MSISKRGSKTPLGHDAPLGDNAPVGDLFNRFEAGIGTPGGDAGTAGSEMGISAPADDVGGLEVVIGISAPTIDDVGPAGDSPAVDSMSSGDAGADSSGVGAWESVTHVTIVDGCSCAACQDMLAEKGEDDEVASQKSGGSPNSANPEGGNIGQLLTLGTNPDGSHFFSGNRNVDATLIGSKWGTLNLTYSFPTSGSNYNGATFDSNGVSLYHIDLGALQQAGARSAFAQIQAATGLTFTEITDTDTVHANIRISQTADADVPSAYGNFPSDTKAVAGDIWFGRNNQPFYDFGTRGTWGFSTMMHEIGHTMGLKHGHQDYTNLDLSFYFGTAPRVGSQSLTPDRDGQAWSLMTYTPAPGTSGFAGDKISQPQTYMQYDLAALQYMYGANYTTNAGDSVYTFSQTTGEMFIDGVGQGAPSGNKILLTIWDGGGNDTIDASNYANGVTIDLRPGEFSTVDQAQLANHLAAQNLIALAPGNIAMALLYNNDARSLIENATGGVGNDIFVGNTANNILDGGAGSDTVIFTGTTGVNVTLNDTNTDVIVNHDGETDTLRSIENIQGTIGDDSLTGNSQDNTLSGGPGGADVLTGGDGHDRLIGGGFTTTTTYSAPSQPDITKPQSTNNGSIATAVATAGFFDVDANPAITNATSIPHATVNATAAGGSVEYYRIDVTVAGSQAIFDIDGGGTLDDSILELINSGGTVLASNDTGTGDASPPGHDDAYLTFTFATAGTYYIRVGRWTGTSVAQPLLAGQTYQLNISLQNSAAVTTTVTANNTSSVVADGGEGDDVVLGTIASDTLTGGNGNDTASFVNAFNGGTTTGVTVDLNLQGAAQDTVAAGNDTMTGFENLIGSALNDTLTGDGNDNVIEGGLGNDILVGGAGNDTVSYAGATSGVTAYLILTTQQVTGGAGSDTLSGFENVVGSAFNDVLGGAATGGGVVSGGAGDDTLLSYSSSSSSSTTLLDGGTGSDTAYFDHFGGTNITATLNGATDGTASGTGYGAIAILRNIENLKGSAGADILTGDSNANVIEGGLGDDILDGGLGIDTVAFSGSTPVTVNLATLTAQATGWGNDTIVNFENVRTGSGADSVTGDGNDNIFFDGGGADTYDGAGGSDTVDYSAATSTVSVNLSTLTAQNTGTFGGNDTITNIENVVGAAAFSNVLQGDTLANRLTGGSAADTIVGFSGNDVLLGGAGNDLLLGGNNAGTDDASSDTVEGGAGTDFISGGQGNDILRGGDGNDTLVGGAGNTSGQFFTGVDGGNDTYDGGDGTDVAIAVYDTRAGVGASTVGIAFDIGNLAGDSAITFDGVNVGSMTSIERVTFRGTNVNDVVKGGGSLDSLTGNAGDDVLDGWIGNDLLSGGLGSDTLIGGEGLDTATYVNSTAGVTVDLRIQGVSQDTGGEGVDTLIDIEYLAGSNFGDTLMGNEEFNLITDTAATGPAGQTDSLFGFGGNDTLHVTRAAAALATNINMDGGDGNDFIELRSGTLTGFTLAANAAGLVAAGNGATLTYAPLGATSADRNSDVVTVDGGAGNDRIVLTGVASATISAGSGADTVSISMRGASSVNNYQITLGSGADIIQFGVGANAAASTDVATTVRTNRVTDFEIGNAGDKFEMSNFLNLGLTGYTANSNAFASGHLRLTQSGSDLLVQVDRDAGGATNSFVTVFAISNGYTGGFTAFNFDGFIGNLTLTGIGALDETITGATGNDVLSGGDGNDVLIGLGGTDTLNGGNGNDTLNGGSSNDTLNGGAGVDTAHYDGAATIAQTATGWTVTTATEGTDTLETVEIVNDSAPGATLLVGNGGYASIQAAIDASSDGDVIVVASGIWTENLNVHKDVTIRGANNHGIAGTAARGDESVIDGQIVINAAGATLEGLKLVGAALGSLGDTAVEVKANNFTLRNSILDGSGDTAIITTAGITGLDVAFNLIQGYSIGAYISSGTAGSIHDNRFQGDGGPISGLGNGINSESALTAIANNAFDGIYAGTLNFFPFGPDTVDLATFVTGNTITNSGIARPVQIQPTNFTHNILGTDFNEAFIGDNGVTGPLSYDGRGGADKAWGSEQGDSLAGGSGDDELFGNGGNDTLRGDSGNDSLDGGSGLDTATYSGTATIFDNGSGGWNVTDPSGMDSLTNVEIVDDNAAGKTLLVGNGGYATIQSAIDAAADGDIIQVAPGTWTETLNVNKDVTIRGANYGTAGVLLRGPETVIDGQITVNAAGATIDGVKLVGGAAGSLGTSSVEVKANNFTLRNSILDSGNNINTAIVTASAITGLEIASNLLRNYSVGIYVAGGTTSGSIHHNLFQGDGGPATGLANGVNSESSLVTINNNQFNGLYSGSLTLFPFGPDTVDLQSYVFANLFTNTPVARPIQIYPTDLTHNILGTNHNEAFIGDWGLTGPVSYDGRGGDDRAWGSEQGDTLTGGAGNDQLFGNGGADTLSGGDNDDLVEGGAGNDVLSGGSGVDALNGGDDNDNLSGGDGVDTLHGDAGADTADGGEGNDIVFGDSGNDMLAGGNGIDTLNGGDDDDNLSGGAGNDTLNGENGDDTMHGGAGNDTLNGGAGTDTAVYDGHRGDYSIGMITGAGGRIVGFSSVSDNEPGNGNEGADALNSVERVQFTNRTLDATLPVQLFDQTNQLVGTFTTIQAAINGAQDNYTIRVAAGIYDEDLIINVGVRILGARTGAVTTPPPGRDPANGIGETTIIGHAKVTAEDNVILTGLRFLNDSTTTGGGASNPTLQFLTGGGTTGHLVSNSIFWSTVAGGADGVDDRAISSVAIPDGQLSFTGNLISGSHQGLSGTASWGRGLWFGGGGTTLDATGNIVEWTRTGMTVDGVGGSVSIIDSNVLRNLGTGISVITTEDGLNLTGNDFQNVGDEFSFAAVTEDVIFAASTAFDTLVPVGDSNDLIVIRGGTGNDALTGSALDDLIDANGSTTNPTAADNDTLNGGGGNDILLGRHGNDSLRGGAGDDSLDGGAGIDTAIVGLGATFVANGSTWTVTSSQGVDTLVNVERVDVTTGPGSDILLVGSGGFSTIQAAVDAANDGDVILVAAGTYVEQVVVNDRDNLTIRAADGAQVTIQAPADLVETARSSGDREIHSVFTVLNSQNVVLQNIDVDGHGAGNTVDEGGGAGQANFHGVFYRNASGSLINVDVTGVRDSYAGGTAAGGEPLLSGVQRGIAVVVDNDFVNSFTMTGGSITDFQKNAASFNLVSLTMTGVTVTGGGAQTGIVQNGIVVSNSSGTISGNTITGLGHAGAVSYSVGIFGFGNTGLNITGNTITGANDDSLAAKLFGIFLNQTNSGGSITGNIISLADSGIVVRGDVTPDNIVIENNSITNVDGTDPRPDGVDFQPNPALTTPYDVDGSAAADLLAGGAGNDSLSGLGGDDVMRGNGGDDTLDGDGNTDTAAYAGPRSGYTIVTVVDGNGRVVGYSSVTDSDPGNGDEGADTLISVERLSFGDVTLDLTQPVQLFDENGLLVGTFATIQAAVDAASDDYTIRLAAGSYAENVDVDKDVTILGPNQGVAGTGTRGAEAAIDGRVTISADGVTIDGVKFVGADTGPIGDTAVVVQADDFTLVNSVLHGASDFAIFVGLVSGLDVGRNLIRGYSIGAYVSGGDTSGSIHDNRFQGEGGPISGLGNGVNSETSHVLIEDNVFDGIYAGSLNLYPFGPDTVDLQSYITGNTITNSGAARPVQIQPTALTHNILGTDFNEAFIGDNGVTGPLSYDGRGGDDRAWGSEQGDSLTGGTGNDQLFGNGGGDTLSGGDNDDLLTGGAGGDALNGGAGIDTAVYAGPRAGYSVSGTTDSSGRMISFTGVADTDPGNGDEGVDTLSGVEKLQFGDVTLDLAAPVQLFDGSNQLVGVFNTIQAAIDAAADGYTIVVAAGTYAETLDVDKDVSIYGANRGVAGTASRGAETVIDGQIAINSAGVTIDGVRIIGDAAGPLGSTGIVVESDDFTLANSILDGDGDFAIFVGLVSGLDVGHNLIQGYSIGAYVAGGDTSGSIHDNRFQGDGGPLTGLGNGINSETSHVVIEDNVFDGIYAGSLNLYPFGPDSVDLNDYVIDNTITDSGAARPVQIHATSLTHNILGTDFNEAFIGDNGVTGPLSFDGRGGDDRAWGSEQGDSLAGGSGNDMLFGNGGNDTLRGDAGNDSLEGGSGVDTATYAGAATITETVGGWTVADAGGTDTLTSIEIVDDSAAGKTLLVGNGGYATIQAAIDAASDGDTILVASGTWTEDLDVDKQVTILGANHGIFGTGARGDETVIDGQIVIGAAGVVIDGVKIVGEGTGPLGSTAILIEADDFTLSNSVLDGSGNFAMFTGLVTGLDIGHNLIRGYSIGIYVSGGDTTGSIHDNRFQGDGGPLTGLANGVNSESSHVAIAQNVFDGIYAGSLNIFPFGPDSVDLNDYITGNTITDSGVARPVQILPTNLTHNIVGTDFNEAFDGETAAGSYGVTGAFSFDGRGGDDKAWGGEQGDTFAGGSGTDELNGNGGNDTLTGGTGNDALNGGNGTDTGVYAGPFAGYNVTVTTGPDGRVTGFTAVSDSDPGNGDEGTDALNSVERLQFGDITLDLTQPVQLFDGSNKLVGTFGTIQAAVDAASAGYTILLAAGTYAENVTVDVDVTIKGPNAGTAGTATRVAEAIIDGGVHMNAAGATLDGVTVLGGGTVGGNSAGIYVDVDNVTLTNLIVRGDGTTGIGILTLTNGAVSGLLISNSLIEDWTNGTYFNPTTQFTATGNTFDGNTVALSGDDWDDGTLISNNVFTNSSVGHVGYGVLDTIEDVGIFFGTGNSFDPSGGRIGIFAYGDGDAGGQTISGTAFDDMMVGVEYVAGSGNGATFLGLGGNDWLQGNAGDDTLNGGEGNDTLIAGSGEDNLIGGNGSDVLYFGAHLSPGDQADGGAGQDGVVLQGNYTITLNPGLLTNSEALSLQTGSNPRWGDTAGNNYTYDITSVDENVPAGARMTINGRSLGADENFTFNGSAETDGSFFIFGGHGIDDLTGGAGIDIFFFEVDRWQTGDKIDGGAGRDALVISAGNGLNRIDFADDSLTNIESVSVNNRFATDRTATPSYEFVFSNGNVAPGATLIVNAISLTNPDQTVSFDGSAVHDGNFLMFGGAGNDTLTGGFGADTLIGGLGSDFLIGGPGADRLEYRTVADSTPDNPDTLISFEHGIDKIDLSRIDTDPFAPGDQPFIWIGSAEFTGDPIEGNIGELRAYEDDLTGIWFVEADMDADGIADFVLQVTMQGGASLTVGDFIL